MSKFVYIDSIITAVIFILSAGILFWLSRFIRRNDSVAFRKGLLWVIPLIVVSFIDLFICITIIIMIPNAPAALDASDRLYKDAVLIRWRPSSGAKAYAVWRSLSPEGPYSEIGTNILKTIFVDTTVPPGRYYYRIVASNAIGKSIGSNVEQGSPAISDQKFFRIYLMTERGALAKLKKLGGLGKEDAPGSLGGSVSYDAKFHGRAHAVNSYVNYCDYDKKNANSMTLNGTLSTEADILGNGTTIGRINVSGLYNGSVTYNLVIKNRKKAGGYYLIRHASEKSPTILPWNFQ